MPVTLLQDTFTDANGTNLTAHTMNVGPGWTVDDSLGSAWTIQSNEAQSPNIGFGVAYSNAGSGASDGTVSADITTSTEDSYYGLACRVTDRNNLWIVGLVNTENKFVITQVTGGIYTIRASIAFTTAPNTTYTISVTLQGQTITATVNGSNQIQYTSAAQNVTGTNFGFRGGAVLLCDNFLMLSTPPLASTQVAAVSAGAGSVSVTTLAGTGGVSPLTYKLQRAPNVVCPDPYGTPGTFADVSSYGSSLTITDSDVALVQGKQYWYRIVVKDNVGVTSTGPACWGIPLGIPAFPTLSTVGITATYRWAADQVLSVDGAAVATLTEIGGSGKNLTGSTSSPTYQSKGWPFANPCLRFKAASLQYFAASTAADWTFLHDGTPWTVFIAFRTNNMSTTTASRWVLLATGAVANTSKGLKIYYDNKATDSETANLQVAICDGSGAFPLSVLNDNILAPLKMHGLCITFDGTTVTAYDWNSQILTGAKTSSLPTGAPAAPLAVGVDPVTQTGDSADQDMTEVVMVDGAVLSASDRNAVMAYMETKYHPAGNVQKEFLLDSVQVDSWSGTSAMSGLTASAVAPVKYAGNPILGGVANPSYFYLWFDVLPFASGDYRLWAGVADSSDTAAHQNCGYATSTDLVTWTEPNNLHQVTYSGTNNNNLWAPTNSEEWYFNGIWYQGNPAISGQLFLFNFNQIPPTPTAGIFLVATANSDGITGTSQIATVEGSYTGGEAGGITPQPDGRWVITSIVGQPGARSCQLILSDTTDPSGTWTVIGNVIAGTTADQYHGMLPRVFPDANCWVCSCGQLDQSIGGNTINLGLFISRDHGRTFVRSQKTWLPVAAGHWDGNQILVATKPILYNGSWWCHYTASAGQNAITPADTIPFQVGAFTLGVERYFQATGTGAWTGRYVYQPNQNLFLNADGTGGTITVALLDAQGSVISGYGDAQSNVVSSNVTSQQMSWGANTTLPSQAVRIRFTLSSATIYSWKIATAAAVTAQVWPYLDAELCGSFSDMGMGGM